jgi:hypothetical protein
MEEQMKFIESSIEKLNAGSVVVRRDEEVAPPVIKKFSTRCRMVGWG